MRYRQDRPAAAVGMLMIMVVFLLVYGVFRFLPYNARLTEWQFFCGNWWVYAGIIFPALSGLVMLGSKQ